jgi:hypothetical protein
MITLKIRLLGVVVGGLIILMTMYLVRRQKLSTLYSLTWLISGLTLIGVSVLKDSVMLVSSLMGIHFPPLALFVLALIGQTFILIHLSIIVSSQFKVIKRLEKEMAILSGAPPSLSSTVENT